MIARLIADEVLDLPDEPLRFPRIVVCRGGAGPDAPRFLGPGLSPLRWSFFVSHCINLLVFRVGVCYPCPVVDDPLCEVS